MSKYRKKPVIIEARRWNGLNYAEIHQFAAGGFSLVDQEDRAEDPSITAEVFDKLHSTWVGVHDGDWIIKGIQGEFYPIVDSVFTATYEPAD